MKFTLASAIPLLLAAADLALGFTRTEVVLADGTVEVTFANFTVADAQLQQRADAADDDGLALQSRTYPHSELQDHKTRWDYWWYGAGPVLRCGVGQVCKVCLQDADIVPWYVTVGGGVSYNVLRDLATEFCGKKYTFSSSVQTAINEELVWTGPADKQLWLKQWFALTEGTYRGCPTDGKGKCGDWGRIRSWMPCSNKDCFSYSITEPNAPCNYGNHCQTSCARRA